MKKKKKKKKKNSGHMTFIQRHIDTDATAHIVYN